MGPVLSGGRGRTRPLPSSATGPPLPTPRRPHLAPFLLGLTPPRAQGSRPTLKLHPGSSPNGHTGTGSGNDPREQPEASLPHLAPGNQPRLRQTASATQGRSSCLSMARTGLGNPRPPALTLQPTPSPASITPPPTAHSPGLRMAAGFRLPAHRLLRKVPCGLPAPSTQAAGRVWPDKPASVSQTQRPVCLGTPAGASQGQM